ncbi:hypothetical protein, conserved [Eimeria praecox]|uniref:Uncharacterized protein n=1 Tax=Eimeria praecox TaxID=51316 RepID=U6GRF2_9EIME|nr:hypothetical protein, conserved [Eimeria praecox]
MSEGKGVGSDPASTAAGKPEAQEADANAPGDADGKQTPGDQPQDPKGTPEKPSDTPEEVPAEGGAQKPEPTPRKGLRKQSDDEPPEEWGPPKKPSSAEEALQMPLVQQLMSPKFGDMGEVLLEDFEEALDLTEGLPTDEVDVGGLTLLRFQLQQMLPGEQLELSVLDRYCTSLQVRYQLQQMLPGRQLELSVLDRYCTHLEAHVSARASKGLQPPTAIISPKALLKSWHEFQESNKKPKLLSSQPCGSLSRCCVYRAKPNCFSPYAALVLRHAADYKVSPYLPEGVVRRCQAAERVLMLLPAPEPQEGEAGFPEGHVLLAVVEKKFGVIRIVDSRRHAPELYGPTIEFIKALAAKFEDYKVSPYLPEVGFPMEKSEEAASLPHDLREASGGLALESLACVAEDRPPAHTHDDVPNIRIRVFVEILKGLQPRLLENGEIRPVEGQD